MDKITKLAKQIYKSEKKLFKMIEDMDNHMNECDCEDQEEHSFINTLGHDEINEYCLNCGGYIALDEVF
jgi:hypothetical protein